MTPAIVEVEWVDSHRLRLGWDTAKAYRKLGFPLVCRTVGYVIADEPEYVCLALNVAFKSKGRVEMADAMAIPRASILSQVTLRGATEEPAKAAGVPKHRPGGKRVREIPPGSSESTP